MEMKKWYEKHKNKFKKPLAFLLCIMVLTCNSCTLAGRVDAQEHMILSDDMVPMTVSTEGTDNEAAAVDLDEADDSGGGAESTDAEQTADEEAASPDTDPSTEETPDADQPSEETPDANQPTEEMPDADQSTEEMPDADQSTEEMPDTDQSTEETPDADQSTEETPDTDQSTEETPDADQSTEETPDTDQTAEETPDADQSAEETPDTDQSEEVPINPGDEKEEQPSKEELLFTEEEQKQIDAVIALIEALPAPEEVMEKLSALEEEQDEEGFDTYYMEFQQQVLEAYEAYAALTEAQQKAVTNAEKLKQYDWMMSETLEETLWDIMKPDEAYVNEIKVTGTATGSAPFDETEGRGNDTTASDLLVRTFDTVTYHFNVNMKTWDTSKSYGQARVKLEFVLPLNENEAVFEQTAMAWMDQTEGYKPVVTEEIRTIDGIEKECQVLTCYKLLLPSEGNHSVVPGDFGENLTIYVRSMKNGEKFAPIISAAMEGGAWDAPCDKEDHKIDGQPAVEKKTVIPEKVEVTAAPKYNIRVSGDSSYHDDFDFQTGGDEAANKDIIKPLPGRSMVLGITLQLYNDNASKGLKGIELPDGSDITFDLKLSSTYKINTPNEGYEQGQIIENISEYAPLLWSYDEVSWRDYGSQNKDGRQIDDRLKATPFAPYTTGGGKTACYQGGSWKATQEGDTIHITVSGYEIDPKQMPSLNADGGTVVTYGENVGCFSSGEIWLIQPFNKKESDSTSPHYDIVNTYGPGAFTTTAMAGNLKVTTVSGDKLVQGENGFQQMVEADDRETRTLELTLEGGLQNRVRYADGIAWQYGCGVEDNRDGRDFAAVGTEINLMGGLSYNPYREEENEMYLGTTLMKFYGTALEIKKEDWFLHLEGGAALNGFDEKQIEKAKENVRIYYATKKDGSDWENDEELKRTYEDSLEFYDSLDEIPAGKTCVGMLICFVGPSGDVKMMQDPYYRCYHKATVRDNMGLAGQTFMLASTSRLWTKQMFEERGITLDDIDLEKNPDLNVPELVLSEPFWGCSHYTSANIEGSVFYDKETYLPDGSGIKGTHNSDWYHWGDTLLVIGYRTAITKKLLQKDENDNEKKTFNLDADQRVADFVLQPRTYYDQSYYDKPAQAENRANITIVDILPEHLTYKAGSAYFGGVYKQTSSLGGTKGTIIRDETPGAPYPDPKLREPVVTNNEDGTQTLTWIVADVKIGDPMPPIYYSADIGVKGDPNKDIPTGTKNLQNKVYITTPNDLRDPETTDEKHAMAGITVTRGSASSFGKYAKQRVVDEDGEIDYVVYFNNNADTSAPVAIMDTMPMNPVSGSHFTGTYTFTEWKLDTSKCDVSKLEIYYTFDTGYQDKTISGVTQDEIRAWTKAQVGPDGTIAIPSEKDGATKEQPYPVAWAVVGGLDAHKSVNIDLKIKLDPGSSNGNKTENNYFINRLSSGDTTTTTETPTVRRTLEGLTWMDYNRDGVQNDLQNETRISGIQVELLKLKDGCDPEAEDSYESVCYPGTDTPIVIKTGEQISVRAEKDAKPAVYETGRYKFTDLPAGTFAVRFTDGEQSKISTLNATKPNAGEDDTLDSDGEPVYDDEGKLQKTYILNIVMPKAEDMSVSLFESKHHDSGFYPDTLMKIQKVNEGGSALTDAIFTIQNSKGQTIPFVYKEGEGYTPLVEEEIDPSLEGKYYIAYAKNPKYVMEISGDGQGAVPVLQIRDGNQRQLFEILNRDGDLKCFRSAGTNLWLDLDGGTMSNGAKVHVWGNEVPNENQTWHVTECDGGVRIWPYGNKDYGTLEAAHNWSMDLSGGTPSAGGTIHLWEANNTDAQKWILVPAAGGIRDEGDKADAQPDLSVDSNGSLTVRNLIPGDYTIKEIKSPAGYALLREPVSFTLKTDGTVEVKSGGGMASVEAEDGKNIVLKIRNEELYELPKTGGIGTHWYTISGSLLMMAGMLVLYKKKRAGRC